MSTSHFHSKMKQYTDHRHVLGDTTTTQAHARAGEAERIIYMIHIPSHPDGCRLKQRALQFASSHLFRAKLIQYFLFQTIARQLDCTSRYGRSIPLSLWHGWMQLPSWSASIGMPFLHAPT